MSKKVTGSIKLVIPAGQANPAPPIGPALGSKGVNIQKFCMEFNEVTKSAEKGVPIAVSITVFEDKSFTFVIKTSPVSYYLKKFAGISKGSSATRKEPNIAVIDREKVAEIAKIKMVDLSANDLEAAIKIICGTATSMGIEVR